MKYTWLTFILLFFFQWGHAQNTSEEKYLQQMVDSVNYLLTNSEDGSGQPTVNIMKNGDIAIIFSNKSAFRFNLFELKPQNADDENEKGIQFVPEVKRSITTNKWIIFNTRDKVSVGFLKFTQTADTYVHNIHLTLLRIRTYIEQTFPLKSS